MSQKIQVCHICNLGMNGKAVFVCNLLEHTDYEKYDVTIINFRSEHAKPIIERIEKLPVKIVEPQGVGLKNFCLFLNRHFKTTSYDVCHSHIWDLSGLFLTIAKHNHIKCRVAHSHNTSKAEGRYNWLKGFVRDKILWNCMRFLLKISANRYMACSEEAAAWLFPLSIVRNKKYTVVSNGFDLYKFSFPDRVRHQPTEILFAGRMVYQKNPLFAVNAFSEFLKVDPSAHMTMVGSGKMDLQVDEEIKRLGIDEHVTRVRETSEMDQYYKNADLYLFPSNYEGLGITLIEAQASGLKCLASDTVPKESQCGLVEYRSLGDGYSMWGRYISELLESVKAVDENALEYFDVKNTAKQVDAVYGLK